jgi:hypothetical protein
MKFKCLKSKIQEYECQVCAKPFFSKDKFVCFDKCLADELFYLWKNGIRTTGCCCGHHINSSKETAGYIGVDFADIQKMKDLGYKVAFNSNRPDDEDSFTPKTNFNK